MEPLYKVGDKVRIKSKYDPGKNEESYYHAFLRYQMLIPFGGKVYTIKEVVRRKYERPSKIPDDGYQYYLVEIPWTWSSSMFEEKVVDKQNIIMKPLYKVGDKVLVKKEYDPGHGMGDYRFLFTKYLLKQYGGKVVTIAGVKRPLFPQRTNILPDDGYLYQICEDKTLAWSSSMFESEF